jgi:hypothetical protein
LPAKKSEQVARARVRKKGGCTESGCGGAAEPPAASQDDALGLKVPACPPARPPTCPKLLRKKGGGWFEIETAKMTSTKTTTLRDQEAACFLNWSNTEQTCLCLSLYLSLSLSLSLFCLSLFFKNSKSRRPPVHGTTEPPFPLAPKFLKNKRSRFSLVALQRKPTAGQSFIFSTITKTARSLPGTKQKKKRKKNTRHKNYLCTGHLAEATGGKKRRG